MMDVSENEKMFTCQGCEFFVVCDLLGSMRRVLDREV